MPSTHLNSGPGEPQAHGRDLNGAKLPSEDAKFVVMDSASAGAHGGAAEVVLAAAQTSDALALQHPGGPALEAGGRTFGHGLPTDQRGKHAQVILAERRDGAVIVSTIWACVNDIVDAVLTRIGDLAGQGLEGQHLRHPWPPRGII